MRFTSCHQQCHHHPFSSLLFFFHQTAVLQVSDSINVKSLLQPPTSANTTTTATMKRLSMFNFKKLNKERGAGAVDRTDLKNDDGEKNHHQEKMMIYNAWSIMPNHVYSSFTQRVSYKLTKYNDDALESHQHHHHAYNGYDDCYKKYGDGGQSAGS
ncbi:hypothetical protein FF38_06404 [Lucilia cuprina]|uniref:Uncharacterized protein n=1 Tax=Lucilia cuprina TaxID=7375 RepID=A0A0L0BSU4_LUCCU|nr:hypothetical protein FF38_06404 [Lucilia cuprina]